MLLAIRPNCTRYMAPDFYTTQVMTLDLQSFSRSNQVYFSPGDSEADDNPTGYVGGPHLLACMAVLLTKLVNKSI